MAAPLIRAVALVGFYRGADLVQPGQILNLTPEDFGLHHSYHQVDHAPPEPPPAPAKAVKK